MAQGCLWNAAQKWQIKPHADSSIDFNMLWRALSSFSLFLFLPLSLFNGLRLRNTAQRRGSQNCCFSLWLKCLGKIVNPTELKARVAIGLRNFLIFSFLFLCYEPWETKSFWRLYVSGDRITKKKAKHFWNDKCYVYILLVSFLKVLVRLWGIEFG